MVLVNAWKKVVQENYANFSGRAGLPEFWWYILANLVIGVIFWILILILGSISDALGTIVYVLYLVYALAVLIPGIALVFRRLHDSDKSGWFILLGLIPCAGPIILIVFYLMAGTPGDNKYGPPPVAGPPQPGGA